MTPAENLRAAADLIEPEGAWTQGKYARDEYSHPVPWDSADAVCFCAAGAIRRAAKGDVFLNQYAFERFVRHKFGHQFFEVANWNDAETTTQADVIKAMRDCADELEGEEG